MRIIAGLERADGGSVRLRGLVVDAPPSRRTVPPERRGLGMVFQEHALWPHLTALEDGVLAQAGPPQALYMTPATLTVARYMGAEGCLPVRGDGVGRVRTTAGVCLAARSPLPPEAAGIAVAHPDGVRLAASGGVAAVRRDAAFEAGQWRTRWRVGDGELLGLHGAPPPPHALLDIDPAKLFAFPAAR